VPNTNFKSSAWGKRRSWSQAEEDMLVACLEPGGPHDAYDMPTLATYFHRVERALYNKIRSLGYDVPSQCPDGRKGSHQLTDLQITQLGQFYEAGATIQDCVLFYFVRYKKTITANTMRKLLAERAGVIIRSPGRALAA